MNRLDEIRTRHAEVGQHEVIKCPSSSFQQVQLVEAHYDRAYLLDEVTWLLGEVERLRAGIDDIADNIAFCVRRSRRVDEFEIETELRALLEEVTP